MTFDYSPILSYKKITMTMEELRERHQSKWTNTVTAFKRQHSMMKQLITEANLIISNAMDPKKKVDGMSAKQKVDPIKRKLEILDKYVDNLSTILPDAAYLDDGNTWAVTALNNTLDKCMNDAQAGHEDLQGVLESFAEWKRHQKKDPDEDKTGVTDGEGANVKAAEIKGVATSLKPEELTTGIAAYDMSLWIEQWEEFKNNSVFSRHGEESIIAYLKSCVSREVLNAISYKTLTTEKEYLDAIKKYLNTKVHPKEIRQLEIWRTKQGDHSTVADSMRRQVRQFFDTNMDENTPDDWIKLLLYTTCQDKELLSKILARTRTLKTPQDVIDFADAEELGKLNADRLLGGKATVARVKGDIVCFICQKPGHVKSKCKVDKSKLFCSHCNKKGIHNTNNKCPEFKGKNQEKKLDPKKTDGKRDRNKRTKVRTVKGGKEDEPEDPPGEDDEGDSDSGASVHFVGNRVRWWPGDMGSEADSEDSSQEVFFMDSEDESEDGSSESGYYTPPNSPEYSAEDLITDDNDSLISEDEYMNLIPALSSDTEPDSDSDDDHDDIFDDPIPWEVRLSSHINRNEQELPPGCPGMTPADEEPVDIDSVEHQENILWAFNQIADIFEAQEKERAAKSQGDSKEVVPPQEVETKEFDSEDDEDLLKCAELNENTECVFENTQKYVFMTSNMISYIINYPLSDKLSRLSLNVKKIFTVEEQSPPNINFGDWVFSNPWSKGNENRRQGILTSPELNPGMCTCEFCTKLNSSMNLRPGSRGKIRAVSQYAKEAGVKDSDILGYGAPTPLVTLKIMAGCQSNGSRVATLRVTPDTGATVDIIRNDVARKIGAVIYPNSSGYKLTDAQNSNIKIIGTTNLRMQRPNGKWRSIMAIVTEKLSDSLLLSWNTQKFLGILPMNWPHELHARAVGPRKLCNDPEPIKIEVPEWPPPHFSSKMRELCDRYSDVLVDELKAGEKIFCPEMEIRLKEGYKGYICRKPRAVPFHWRKHIDREIQKLLREGIIERANGRHLTFVSPAHWVPKNKDESRFRLVTDLRKLNDSVIPDTSVFPSPARVMSMVKAKSSWFIVIDLLSGYHQIGIKDQDKHLFGFMLDEGKQGGVFVYTSAPMGFINSGHSFVQNLSILLADLELLSEVDDILLEGESEDEVLKKFELLLERCRKHNIKISKRKVQCGEQVVFAGVTIGGKEGFKPARDKCQAITDLSPPTSIKEVRAFLGMANSFRNFMPNMSSSLENIRRLLGKDQVFLWTQAHEDEFEEFKKMINGPLGLKPFDSSLKTQLWVDFSQSGMGFVLTQVNEKNEEDKRVIWCDSTALTAAQSRYSSIYGEHTAMVWAILRCQYWLRGIAHFDVMSDQIALSHLYSGNRELSDFPEEIRNLAEATMKYNFSVKYIKGSQNTIADFFSRHPVFGYGQPTADNLFGKPTPVEALVRVVHSQIEQRRAEDPALASIKEQASVSDEYQAVLETLKSGLKSHEIKTKVGKSHPARKLQNVWSRLGILPDEHGSLMTLDNTRLVIPEGAQKKLVNQAHMSHQGVTRTLQSLSVRYYWPRMRNMVQDIVQDCEYCAKYNRAQPRDPPVEPEVDLEELDPMEMVGLDVFFHKDKYYLIMADLATGFTFCELLGKSTTCKETTEKLKRLFESFGYPRSIRYDGGPHFRGEFTQMLQEYEIPETPSSPYNHESNGLAERHVGVVKLLLKKCLANRQDFRSALATLNATARHDGYSPSDLFFRRRLRTSLPTINYNVDYLEGQKTRSRTHQVMREGMRGGVEKSPFQIGDVVQVKEEIGKHKGQFGGEYVITHVRPRKKSYFVKNIDTGRTYLRSLDRLKLHKDYKKPEVEAKSIKLTKVEVKAPIKGILKKPGSRRPTLIKNVGFDSSFHTARIIAKQSIKEWIQSK